MRFIPGIFHPRHSFLFMLPKRGDNLGNISNVSYKIILSSAMTVGFLPSETNSLTREVVSEKKEGSGHLLKNEFCKKKKWKLIRDVWA